MMRNSPRRRWYQLGLRTWFVFVAILAWGLALRPYFVEVVHYGAISQNGEVVDPSEPRQTPTLFAMTFQIDFDGDQWAEEYGPNPRLLGPIFALAAFVAWKVSWRTLTWWMDCNRTFNE